MLKVELPVIIEISSEWFSKVQLSEKMKKKRFNSLTFFLRIYERFTCG